MIKLTKEHKNYKLPDNNYIFQELENLGYDYYLPKNLFNDLINLCCYELFNNNHYLGFNLLDDSLTFNFLNNIKYKFYKTYSFTPLEMSINILKDLSSIIDFRSYEQGFIEQSKNNSKFIIENGFLFEDDEDITIDKKIIEDISLKILGLFNKKSDNYSDLKSNRNIIKTSEFLKTKKSNFVKPLFINDIINKNLCVTDKEKLSIEEDIIVYFEDASNSMSKNKGYHATKAFQNLLLQDNRTVHFYRYYGNNLDFQELITREDKLKEFKSSKRYFITNCDYNFLFNHIIEKYTSGDIIIVTDGNDSLPIKIKNNNLKFHFIDCSNYNNLDMKKLSKITHGKYIKI